MSKRQPRELKGLTTIRLLFAMPDDIETTARQLHNAVSMLDPGYKIPDKNIYKNLGLLVDHGLATVRRQKNEDGTVSCFYTRTKDGAALVSTITGLKTGSDAAESAIKEMKAGSRRKPSRRLRVRSRRLRRAA